ncbi:MAG: hypothetical protein HXO04_04520 [Prevotella salivae]|uniref:hypothetical protein n=1 Tax=Segatella salivae TaxID=228604 RepID=UPI001CAE8359|nr:hypothetical protein [Segatella salivae]MBF1548783.1 hypothetical protein [Segatella salivae]
MKSYSKPFKKTLQLEFDSMLLAGSGGSGSAGQFTPGGSSLGQGSVTPPPAKFNPLMEEDNDSDGL